MRRLATLLREGDHERNAVAWKRSSPKARARRRWPEDTTSWPAQPSESPRKKQHLGPRAAAPTPVSGPNCKTGAQIFGADIVLRGNRQTVNARAKSFSLRIDFQASVNVIIEYFCRANNTALPRAGG